MTSYQEAPVTLRVAGELVVIVVGVLIALWVDNLNEDRRELDRAESYLAGILVDLRSDSLDLADRRAISRRTIGAADHLLELERDHSSAPGADSLATWIFYSAFVDNFQVLDHTYREVLGAGGLSLIPDDGLRRQISEYYRSIESADFFTFYYKKEESDFWDLLELRLDPDDFGGISTIGSTPATEGNLSASRVLAVLRSDPAIVNAIQMNRHWTVLRLSVNESRIRRNSELATVLRGALASTVTPNQ
jgi:hypothetical protein